MFVKDRAIATQEPGHQIVATVSDQVSAALAGQLPQVRNMKQGIRRARRRVGTPLPSPSNLQELDIPEQFKKTTAGNEILLYALNIK